MTEPQAHTAMIKSLLTSILTMGVAFAQNASVQLTDDKGTLHVPAKIIKEKDIPHFYGTTLANNVHITEQRVNGAITAKFVTLQGKSKKYSLRLSQSVKQLKVTGQGIKHWAVRKEANQEVYYLDIFPSDEKVKNHTVTISYSIERKEKDSQVSVLSLTPVKKQSVGFSEKLVVSSASNVRTEIATVSGYLPVSHSNEKVHGFVTTTGGKLTMKTQSGALYLKPLNLRKVEVGAVLAADGKSAIVSLSGDLHVNAKKGGSLALISGKLALLSQLTTEGFAMEYAASTGGYVYSVKAEKKGVYPIKVSFAVKVDEVSGWYNLHFKVHDGAVVPVSFLGLENAARTMVEFDKEKNVVPSPMLSSIPSYSGFLPADGRCDVAWRGLTANVKSELFYTTSSIVDVRVGGGLITQRNILSTRILQGKLSTLTLKKSGQGDVISVTGKHVSHWNLDADGNILITLTGSYEKLSDITIETQQPLGTFPAKVHPVQLTPTGAERHTGYVRAFNSGAVSIAVSKLKGMMQVTPQQFPHARKGEKFHQVYVYRFPSKERDWHLEANQILPEISVRHLLIYGVGASDRSIFAEINLDVREAPLREWNVRIPEGFAVSSVKGHAVNDYVLSSQVVNGMRSLKILFKNPVLGRHLVQLSLEENKPASEGIWTLPQIDYPGVEDVRGQIGVASALGWKIVTNKVDQLAEIPLAYFQKKDATIQQSYRQRKADWSASVKIEKLSQSVQADVFHLYTLKEGSVECAVFLNYFVVGAPVSEWRLKVPESAGNISVVGQNVRSHSRSGEYVIVTLEQPVLGGANLVIKFEESMKAEGGKLALGQVTPLGVQSESGFVQVISPMQVKHELAASSKGLLKLEEAELPAEYRVLSTVPTVAAWQYAARPFELAMNIEWFSPSEIVGQSIDYATIFTEVAKGTDGGRIKTSANFFVKTRGKQSLRMKLPAGAELDNVEANGKALIARKDGEFILLPLPAQNDPNKSVEVVVRYRSSYAKGEKLKMGLPVFSAPSVITNWSVKSADEELLIPVGGNITAKQPARGQTGFGWLAQNMKYLFGTMALLAAGVFIGKGNSTTWKSIIAVCWLAIAVVCALNFAQEARSSVGQFDTSFDVVAPVVAPNSEVLLEVEQLSSMEAMISPLGILILLIGLVAMFVPMFVKTLQALRLPIVGLVLISAGLLMQYGGAVVFFGLLALLSMVFLVVKLRSWILTPKASVAALLVAMLGLSSDLEAKVIAPQVESSADSISEVWEIRENRLKGKATIMWKSKVGERLRILRSPATLAKFDSNSCRVEKGNHRRGLVWSAIAEKEGNHTIVIEYEMPMPNLAENAWAPVSASAMVRKMSVTVDQANWQTNSAAAVHVTHRTKGNESTSELVLLPKDVMLEIKPKKKDPDAVAVKYFAETKDLYMPAPGVLDGWHEVTINPISGRLRKVELLVPAGMMVGDVQGAQVNSWTFDPKKLTLLLQLKKPMSSKFTLHVATQKGIKAFPSKLELAPIRVKGANKVVGMLGLGFGGDAQPDAIKVEGMNAANIDDFATSMTNYGRRHHAGFVLHKAYRYSQKPAKLNLSVDAVSPELRVQTVQNLYIGDERVHLNTLAQVKVTRAGVFNTRFVIPEGFEVESVTGKDLRDYTESEEAGTRILTLHLNGKKLGVLQFKVSLTAAALGQQDTWEVPQLLLEGAVRQSGELTIYPQRGIQVSAVMRKHVTQEDSREIRKKHPGAISFRLLQADSVLKIAIDKLDPWVVAQMLQEVTLRDGQTRTRLGLRYTVTHAAVKELFIRIPGLEKQEEGTVRVSGVDVKGITKVKDDLWKVTLRRGMIGKFGFDVEFQKSADRVEDKEAITPVSLVGTKQSKHFVAVRANERLDMETVTQVKGWRVADWKSVPRDLYHVTNSGVPEMSFQLIEPQGDLTVQIRRHAMADTLKLRVRNGEMTTLFSSDGSALNHLILNVEVVEKSAMSVTLPSGASLFSVIVNGDAVPVVKEGEVLRFNVTPGSNQKKSVTVQVVYSNSGDSKVSRKISLKAPKFNVPLERVLWNVILPEGVRLKKFKGDFKQLDASLLHHDFSKSEYQSSVAAFKSSQKKRAEGMMKQVGGYIKSGERGKATEILNRIARNKAVGQDMNEDAHELLTKNQLQHALMGLNTRRQRMYLDNKAEGNTGAANLALEEAASRNPLFQGNFKYDPNQVQDFMQGMSQDEQDSLIAMAKLMVDTDVNAVSAPQVIDVTIPEMGTVLEFERKLQLNQNEELTLDLVLEDSSDAPNGLTALILLIIAAGSALMFWKR